MSGKHYFIIKICKRLEGWWIRVEERTKGQLNYNIIFLLILLFCISCLAIYSAQLIGQYNENFVLRQAIWYVVGAGIIAFVMLFDAEQLQKLSWYLYFFSLLILILLIIAPESIARPVNGAKSWFQLPGIGSVQPSEFTKVTLTLVLSNIISKHNESHTIKSFKTDVKLMMKMIGATLLPIGLIMMQPDLGTSLVLISIFCGLFLLSGIGWRIITSIFFSGISIAAFVLYMVVYQPEILEKYLGVREYQFGRIYAWLNPEEYASNLSFHLVKSLLAIGSGMIQGKGFTNGEVYIPEGHTDFIFSIIGEEFGFLGASFVISVYMLLIYNIIVVALNVKDTFASYVCTGVISMITFHVFQNIGMCIGLLPITGIPLPFISYGGSSLMGNMLAIGLVLSISFRERRYMFSAED